MAFIVLAEGTGWSLAVLFKIKNHWVYNIELLGEICFFSWVFREIFRPGQAVKYILGITVAALIIVFAVESIQTRIVTYNSKTSLVFSVFLIVCCGVYYYLLLAQAKHEELNRHPEFWLVSGVFVFYFASTAVTVFFEELMRINIAKGIPVRYVLFTGLNAVLYGLWCYAFRCRQKQTIQLPR